jgi:hypothetical protein
MSGRLAWTRGGEARIVSVVGNGIGLRSTIALPPGARVEGTLEETPPVVVRVKVSACRKIGEGEFEVHARLIDVTREVRERLLQCRPA